MIKLKRKFSIKIVILLSTITLLFAGCLNSSKSANNLKSKNNIQQVSTNSIDGGTSVLKKDAKNVTDNDLLNSANEDSPTQLDSIDNQSQQLGSDEIDSLLNDNSELNNLSLDFTVK